MPLYEYICRKCGKAHELLVASSGRKVACPDCGSTKMERQFSTFAAHSGAGRSGQFAGCPAAGSCPSGGDCASGHCPMAE